MANSMQQQVLKERIKHARDISTRPLAASTRHTPPPNATIETAFFGNNSAPMSNPGTNQSAQFEEQAKPASERERSMRAGTLDLLMSPGVFPCIDVSKYRTGLDSRDYHLSPFDSSSDSEDDKALEIETGHEGSEERVYRGKCSRGSVLEFLQSVMFVWPNELDGRLHEVTDSLQNVEFASRDHRFRLDDFSHSLLELHERLHETPIGLARDEDLDQLQAKLNACEDAVELCENFTSTVKLLIARDVPLERLGNVRLLYKGLSDSKQDI